MFFLEGSIKTFYLHWSYLEEAWSSQARADHPRLEFQILDFYTNAETWRYESFLSQLDVCVWLLRFTQKYKDMEWFNRFGC